MNHTPTPWKIVYQHDTHKVKRDTMGRMLGDVVLPLEDYQYAVECVNAHAALVDALANVENYGARALGEITAQHTGWYYQLHAAVQQARKALALVEGKETTR